MRGSCAKEHCVVGHLPRKLSAACCSSEFNISFCMLDKRFLFPTCKKKKLAVVTGKEATRVVECY